MTIEGETVDNNEHARSDEVHWDEQEEEQAHTNACHRYNYDFFGADFAGSFSSDPLSHGARGEHQRKGY